MKLDSSSSSSLTGYLVTKLRPLTPADPAILAEYVVALLKKDKPMEELQKLCADNLEDFLGHSTKSFINNLFQALEDGSIVRPVDSIDAIKNSEPSACTAAVDPLEPRTLPSKDEKDSRCKKEQELSTSSGPGSDPEDQEVSDDDDDRNHKHRRRDPQPMAFDKCDQRQFIGRPKSRRNKNFENGELFQESHPYLNETKREYNPSLERDSSLKFEKRRPGMPLPELGQRNRINQSIRNDSGPRFDLSTSLARPPGGRGRGRGTGSWSQHDSRFVPLGALDFASHMASQGPNHPSMFVGTSLPSAASTQNASWGAFGFVPGMPSMCLDPLHPLGLQGTLHSSVSSQLNLTMPRQRCRDFEEQGFCLRGDMCPMEHGVNRIVVEDVQSLSQFNLPVSLPSTHTSGLQAGAGPVNPIMNSKSLPSKSSKVGVTDVGSELNDVLHSSIPGVELDVYDPDQPLWNNDHSETSKGLLRLPPPKVDGTEPLWDVDPSENHGFKFSDSIETDEPPSSSRATNINPQLRRRIGSGAKLKMSSRAENIDNETKEDNEETITNTHGALNHSRVGFMGEINPKIVEISSAQRFRKDARRNTAGTSQQKLRTLFVSRIPQNSNKKGALLSHFEKFGKVIDIYIPLNSEKAFVQFSKWEEAEAALKAPDAVMGNRFIKLFWANRDNVVDEKEGRPVATSVAVLPRTTFSAPLRPSNSGGKESPSSTTPKASNRAVDGATPSDIQSKALTVSTIKATPAQKKLEALELLKEELRKKHELLAQKRNNFRNQLDKMEKQAVSLQKVEPESEQPFKKHKSDKDVEVPKAPIAKPVDYTTTTQTDCEKAMDKKISGDGLALINSKADPVVLKQLSKSAIQTNNLSVPSVNRFKLDNRPTGFRILPPLPADFSNVAAIKEHFSTFSDLSTVELEDPDDKSSSGGLKPSPNCSACITFTTRHSAEKAFLGGKCWQGHNLQFAWLTASSNINQHGAQQTSPRSNLREVKVVGLPPENVVAISSLSSPGVSSLSVMSKMVDTKSEPVEKTVDAPGNGEEMDVDGVDRLHEPSPEEPLSATISSSHKAPPVSDVPVVEDGAHVGSAQ